MARRLSHFFRMLGSFRPIARQVRSAKMNRTGSSRMGRPPLALLALATVVAAATLLPVISVGRQAIEVPRVEVIRLLWRPRVGTLLTNTLELAVVVTIFCAVIGVVTGWLIERTDLPGRR